MLYKHLFNILCGHLNLNKKRKKLNLSGYQSNRPVYRSNQPVYRSEPVERRSLNSNLNLTGNRPNRTGIPEPDASGLAGPVGKVNPGQGTHIHSSQTPSLSTPERWRSLRVEPIAPNAIRRKDAHTHDLPAAVIVGCGASRTFREIVPFADASYPQPKL